MARDVVAEGREAPEVDGRGVRVALVCGRFNDHITIRLLEGSRAALAAAGVSDADVHVTWVPGAFEVPLAAKAWAESGRVDAVVGLGAVIRGETGHYDFVAGECARGIQDAQLATGIPVIFGVLTTENLDQALDRSGDDDNKGEESAHTALEMVSTLRAIRGH
jgi:6,7-dimethyl-8-ribityllumazine synthase